MKEKSQLPFKNPAIFSMRLFSDGILLDMMMLVVKRVGRSYGGLYDSEFAHDKVFRISASFIL